MTSLDECEVLYTESFDFDEEEGLLLVIASEGLGSDEEEDISINGVNLRAKPIDIQPESRSFQIKFEGVLCHFVMDRFYRNLIGPDDIFSGKNLLKLEKNAFLDFVSKNTLVTQLEKVYYHYCLILDSYEVYICATEEAAIKVL